MNSEHWESSGFIETDSLNREEGKEGITPLYTSASGYTQLFCYRLYGKLRVLKTLRPEFRGNKLYEHLLQKEFAIGYQLDHPHICRTLGWEEREGLGHCILMEYIDGLTLREFMDQGRLTVEMAMKILKEIGEALTYIHSKQTIHRDLKPENILITHNGHNAKLIDFSLSDCDDAYLLKIPAGTRKYMAPEQLRPDAAWDTRSDIYSLGVIVGEMAHLLGNRRLKAISRRCTRPHREQRYASAEEFLNALQSSDKTPHYARRIAWATLLIMALGGAGWLTMIHLFQTPSVTPIVLPMSSAKGHMPMPDSQQPFVSSTDTLQRRQQLEQTLEQHFPLSGQKESTAYKEERKAVEWLMKRN